ncbi:hypothetical protein BCR43DRAFT_484494 [Syncephalastrum racemosum]|uniref:Uncharacterized protein n=1 Tax=Syncephalastrum racemosum TaxID=13706 RepID=A0A1X2HKT5_SYNRA|nr:hypothetical protein BCR43DRAFT_484494 [Syncephalastrum racemosum]
MHLDGPCTSFPWLSQSGKREGVFNSFKRRSTAFLPSFTSFFLSYHHLLFFLFSSTTTVSLTDQCT